MTIFNGKNKPVKIEDKIETIVGAGTELKGTIVSKGSIRIDGTVEGNITSHNGGVILGEKGLIKGNIQGQTVTVGGKIIGNINALHNIDIQVKAKVHGDIYAQQLLITEGAIFEGNCAMSKEKENIVEPDIKSKKDYQPKV